MEFSKETLALTKEIIGRYPAEQKKSALIPVLHLAQAEFDGWLSSETMDYVASIIGIEPIEVYEVASFYSMFNLKPVGKCLLEVCHTGPCAINGAESIVAHLENKLGIKKGETTADGLFTIKTVECLGACGYAPMLQCGAAFHEHLTNEKVDNLLATLKADNKRRTYVESI